jgi:hypothetical protein
MSKYIFYVSQHLCSCLFPDVLYFQKLSRRGEKRVRLQGFVNRKLMSYCQFSHSRWPNVAAAGNDG